MEIDKISLIFIKNKKLLSVVAKGRSTFYMPGGKREKGETDVQTLTREIKEELDVDVIPETIKYYGTFRAQAHGKPAGTTVKSVCYFAEFDGDPVPSSEIEKIVWVTSADADKAPPVGKIILEDLKKNGMIE